MLDTDTSFADVCAFMAADGTSAKSQSRVPGHLPTDRDTFIHGNVLAHAPAPLSRGRAVRLRPPHMVVDGFLQKAPVHPDRGLSLHPPGTWLSSRYLPTSQWSCLDLDGIMSFPMQPRPSASPFHFQGPTSHDHAVEDRRFPKGHCCFILVQPAVHGQRCACTHFQHNKALPGSMCDCGHQSCFHRQEQEDPGQRQEMEQLKKRLRVLERRLSRGHEDALDRVLSRVTEVEENMDRRKEEFEGQLKGTYQNLKLVWAMVDQGNRKLSQHEEQLRHVDEKFGNHEERIEKLGDALEGTERRRRSSSSDTEAWTVHISLLPHKSKFMPFERNTKAYQRCLSRGLQRIVAVNGQDASSFTSAVSKVFGNLLRGRAWMPLQAKTPRGDVERRQGLPLLSPLDPAVADRPYDAEFLRRYCAVCDSQGTIDSLYIAMKNHSLSWNAIRLSPVYLDGLEASWRHDPLLDTDPIDQDVRPNTSAKRGSSEISHGVCPVASKSRRHDESKRGTTTTVNRHHRAT